MENLKKLMEHYNTEFLSRFEASKEKYEEIWNFYRVEMPNCVPSCTNAYGNNIDGPQGIYWVGKNPIIFFVGRENYDWIGAHDFNEETALALPLWFSFFQTAYMPGFWKKVYDICKDIFGDKSHWYEYLDLIAISNACKCYNPDVQWSLHEECNKLNFIFKEVEIVNAPVNVFFTKTFGTLSNKVNFGPGTEIGDSNITKYHTDKRVFYEMNHPGRMSWSKLEILIRDINVELKTKQLI
ncbi:hypothetical protein [Geomobilimonas luticola]|uniref:Uncharacterized protein n=1 Tax=Geomobilimonas luticola TaxID=1114878 RepID=A0ABS5SAX6_9BACT|nr:hypothetical protein [Geomobilimonas luticola]MBT0652340.1 hypothetical protein [Geomobilimonas luticola]